MTDAADGRAGITADLVHRLVADQFPQWADQPITPVEQEGWDNRTYRLGETLSVRLPTAEGYVAAVAKEDRWLPVLAPQLPVAVPEPVATGRPGAGYPHPWSVRRWLPGRPISRDRLSDPVGFARTLAGFLRALWAAAPADDSAADAAAGRHSFYRGCPPGWYDAEVESALATLGERVDQDAARAVWRTALASRWSQAPVWFHGDIAAGNLLVDSSGRLSAVIDFGTSGIGDPACDLVIAWTLLPERARAEFRNGTGLDGATWARARGWALWKSLIMAAAAQSSTAQSSAAQSSAAQSTELELIEVVLADHARS